MVKRFEDESGSLQALDIEHGGEIVTSPFTFVATLNAILEAFVGARCGALADLRRRTPGRVAPQISALSS